MLTKSEVELKHVEMARYVSPIIPQGQVVSGDRPDVRIQTASGVLGVEVTRLRQSTTPGEARTPMEKRGLRSKVLKHARLLYDEGAGPPVAVEGFFSKASLPDQW